MPHRARDTKSVIQISNSPSFVIPGRAFFGASPE
jgi:hypothetical protein